MNLVFLEKPMPLGRDVVITGVGVVSPIGIGNDAFWTSLCEGRSGIAPIARYADASIPYRFGAEITDFDPVKYVQPRKSLKVMSRDIQFAVAAADMACRDAGLGPGGSDPERVGVIFGCDFIFCELELIAGPSGKCISDGEFHFDRWGANALPEMFPLWMLKYMPNMPACHIAIAHDARGTCNSMMQTDASALYAMGEAMRVIERGAADVIITGGTGSRLHPSIWARSHQHSRRNEDPQRASRPFDSGRDGYVNGEGAAAFVLESRDHALARRARIAARLLGYANGIDAQAPGQPRTGKGLSRAIQSALAQSGLKPGDIGHINAHGLSTVADDQVEAAALSAIFPHTPVAALKSYFGQLGAGGGGVELAASIFAFAHDAVPPALNYDRPDPKCPVHVIRGEPLRGATKTALATSQTALGHSAVVVVAEPD